MNLNFQAEILPFYSNQFSDTISINGRQKIVESSPDFKELIVFISPEELEKSSKYKDAFTFSFDIKEKDITIIPFDILSDNIFNIFKIEEIHKLSNPSIVNFSLITNLLLFTRFLNILSYLQRGSMGYFIEKNENQYYCQFVSPPVPQNPSKSIMIIYDYLMKKGVPRTMKEISKDLKLDSYYKAQKNLKKLSDLGLLYVTNRQFNEKEFSILNNHRIQL
ncbi:MAG: hypothetical protein EAX96_06035 [Candidatus Lokiarchaeota archaeon]|nr:hypothetical protein [Candidatus Lokiarchaeota archaeon]